ncbi:hypothetical protein QAD02_014650, partial [Eretmocerus hayati]
TSRTPFSFPVPYASDRPSRLVHLGKTYEGLVSFINEDIYRVWIEIIPEDSSGRTASEGLSNSLLGTQQKARSALRGTAESCFYNGDEISIDECNARCLRVDYLSIRGGDCINTECYCEWSIPGEAFECTYLLLRASERVSHISIEEFIRQSKTDAQNKLPTRQNILLAESESSRSPANSQLDLCTQQGDQLERTLND